MVHVDDIHPYTFRDTLPDTGLLNATEEQKGMFQ
jgi:hypothetical protein